MEKIFGIPINQFMVTLIVLFLLGAAIFTISALRNGVLLKLSSRNVPRRRAQTILIVLGLMLATLLFSASFSTGDTLAHSIRVQASKQLGQVDEVVRGELRDAAGRSPYFSQGTFELVKGRLASESSVDGVMPMIQEQVPVVSQSTRLSEPQGDVLGLDPQYINGFDSLQASNGQTLSVAELSADQAYISSELAKAIDVKNGDKIVLFVSAKPTILDIAGTYERGANPAGEKSLVMPLSTLQSINGLGSKINAIAISNKGGVVDGAQYSDSIVAALKPLLEGTGLKTNPLKADVLKRADQDGSSFSAVFLLFAQFSIAAGIMLIFLIFVMLAAERKKELGITRAVGAQSGHVIRMFAYEGAIYAALAAAVGSVLGVMVGWGMVRIIAIAISQSSFELTFSFNWRTVVIAFTLGMVLTYLVVLLASWRVSKVNIVRAIRDIPEPRSEHRSIKGLIFVLVITILGPVFALLGIRGEQAGPFMLGTSLFIIGASLLALRLGLRERLAYSIAGLGLVAWWLLPADVLSSILPEMKQGIEMFFLSGIMIVLGAVWAVVYNMDLLLAATVATVGRIKGLTPIVRIAVAYPMQNRFRTGMTLAMFSLVVFTLMIMAFIIHSVSSVFEDTDRISGGFHIQAGVSYSNPITDIHTALKDSKTVSDKDFAAIGAENYTSLKLKQQGSSKLPVDFPVRGVDQGYSDSVSYKFAMMTPEYKSAAEVWQALQKEPGTAIVASYLVPTKVNFNVGGQAPDLMLEGFYIQDKKLPEVFLETIDPRTTKEQKLRVIAVLEQGAFISGQLLVSRDTFTSLVSQEVPPQLYLFRLNEGVDAEAASKALQTAFLENGLKAVVLKDEIQKNVASSLMINNLLQGFMGLGLVVGIASLGVIAARSVVERRQQIGMLKAIGFQKGMVQAAFMLESSLIALLGIGIGIALGFGLSPQVIGSFAEDFEGITYKIPTANILIITVIAYGASLLTTYLPAYQASRIYPADALRYE